MQSVASLSIKNQRPSVTISEIDDSSSAAAESITKQHNFNRRDTTSTHKFTRSGKQSILDSSMRHTVGGNQTQRNVSPENFTDALMEDQLFEKIQSVLPSQVPSLRTKYMQPADNDITVEEDDITQPQLNSVIK